MHQWCFSHMDTGHKYNLCTAKSFFELFSQPEFYFVENIYVYILYIWHYVSFDT